MYLSTIFLISVANTRLIVIICNAGTRLNQVKLGSKSGVYWAACATRCATDADGSIGTDLDSAVGTAREQPGLAGVLCQGGHLGATVRLDKLLDLLTCVQHPNLKPAALTCSHHLIKISSLFVT